MLLDDQIGACVKSLFHQDWLKCPSRVLIMQKAHLALIDSLMSLSARETTGQVKMAAEAEQIGVGAPWENALLFWVNKVRSQLQYEKNGSSIQRKSFLDLNVLK